MSSQAVAMGIQEVGTEATDTVISLLGEWAEGTAFEKRAVVAGLCEPNLLGQRETVRAILGLLNVMPLEFTAIEGKLSDGQKALAYGRSVAIVPFPDIGKPPFEQLATSSNRHVRWIVKQNLGKKRLQKMDAEWVHALAAGL